jgi:hypothetical protein
VRLCCCCEGCGSENSPLNSRQYIFLYNYDFGSKNIQYFSYLNSKFLTRHDKNCACISSLFAVYIRLERGLTSIVGSKQTLKLFRFEHHPRHQSFTRYPESMDSDLMNSPRGSDRIFSSIYALWRCRPPKTQPSQ